MTQAVAKMTQELNFMRSATAPAMRATVMIANIMPKAVQTAEGTPLRPAAAVRSVAAREPNSEVKSPKNLVEPSPTAMDSPTRTQAIDTMPMATRHFIIMLMTLVARVRPP